MNLWAPSKEVQSAINRGEKKLREWRQRMTEEAATGWERFREQQEFDRLQALREQELGRAK